MKLCTKKLEIKYLNLMYESINLLENMDSLLLDYFFNVTSKAKATKCFSLLPL